jgi:hypothetical protein
MYEYAISTIIAFVVTVYGLLKLYAPSSPLAADLLHKVTVYAACAAFFCFSRERKYAKPGTPGNPDSDELKGKETASITIIFIRHGESDWNEIFNRGFGPSFPVRVIKGLLRELMLLTKVDSVFVDSPLSPLGYKQAVELRSYLKDEPSEGLIAAVKKPGGNEMSSVIVSSNLRRAQETVAVALWDRIRISREPILIVPHLQEVSRNWDTMSIIKPATSPELPKLNRYLPLNETKSIPPCSQLFDGALNSGNKSLSGNGLIRMKGFAEWAFTRKEDVIIIGGHSLWFRLFFTTYLPLKSTHMAKKKKMVNGGMVGFKLSRGEVGGRVLYRIDEDSVKVLYGGFMK